MRTLFGIAAHLPIVLIFVVVALVLAQPELQRVMDGNLDAAKHITTSAWIRVGVVYGAIILLQMGLSVVVTIHVMKRPDMRDGVRILWILVGFFVGSIGLPLFYWLVFRSQATRPAK